MQTFKLMALTGVCAFMQIAAANAVPANPMNNFVNAPVTNDCAAEKAAVTAAEEAVKMRDGLYKTAKAAWTASDGLLTTYENDLTKEEEKITNNTAAIKWNIAHPKAKPQKPVMTAMQVRAIRTIIADLTTKIKNGKAVVKTDKGKMDQAKKDLDAANEKLKKAQDDLQKCKGNTVATNPNMNQLSVVAPFTLF